jgi:hypothetical protein
MQSKVTGSLVTALADEMDSTSRKLYPKLYGFTKWEGRLRVVGRKMEQRTRRIEKRYGADAQHDFDDILLKNVEGLKEAFAELETLHERFSRFTRLTSEQRVLLAHHRDLVAQARALLITNTCLAQHIAQQKPVEAEEKPLRSFEEMSYTERQEVIISLQSIVIGILQGKDSEEILKELGEERLAKEAKADPKPKTKRTLRCKGPELPPIDTAGLIDAIDEMLAGDEVAGDD